MASTINYVGSLQQILFYFEQNSTIFQKQRDPKDHMERIMLMLSQQNMFILEKQFQLYPKGLQLPTFIYLMRKLYQPQCELSKFYFVTDLIKFFQAIDVNGDGHLQWCQFTEYIIENIRKVEKPSYKNKTYHENQVISTAYSKVSNQYKLTKVIDPLLRNTIQKILYTSKDNHYYLLEAGSSFIQVYNSHFQELTRVYFNGDNKPSVIIDFSLDKSSQILGAIFQGTVYFCNMKMLIAMHYLNKCQDKKMKSYHKIEYLSLHAKWAFMSKYGQMKLCTVKYKTRTQIQFEVVIELKLHQGLITSVCQIDDPLYIISSSMDGQVQLYSVMLHKSLPLQHISDQKNSVINNRNKKGVLGLDFIRQFGSYILTWGFSSDIYIYSLDISLTKGFLHKYRQHFGCLITACFLKTYPYVLSFDDRLNLRIWDFRTLQTIQIINCQKNFVNPSYLQIIPELSQCLICDKKITQFKAPSLEMKSKEINQFHQIIDFKICTLTNNIYIFTSNDVRVYNYINGNLQRMFAKLQESNYEMHITSAQFGYKSMKFFVGDAGGYIRQFCSETGEFLQSIVSNESITEEEVTSIVKIIFLKEHSLLICCSLNGRIVIYFRNSQSEYQLIRDIRQTHFQLKVASASSRYCVLATAGYNNSLNIWNLQKITLQAVMVFQYHIVEIIFSPIHPIMFIAEDNYCISLAYIHPYPQQCYVCFCKIVNPAAECNLSSISMDLILTCNLQKYCSSIMQGIQGHHHLIAALGDSKGCISLVNWNPIIKLFSVQQNHQILTTKKTLRCEVHYMRTQVINERKKILQNGYSNSHIKQIQIKFSKTISAYESSIEKVLLVKQNGVVLSTSTDKKLKVWTLEGELNGVVDFFTFKKMQWKMMEVNLHRKIQQFETTIYSIKLLENKNFTEEEEEQIKVHLLINEFMNNKEKKQYLSWIDDVHKSTEGNEKLDQTHKIQPNIRIFQAKKNQSINQPLSSAEFKNIYKNLVSDIGHRIKDLKPLSSISPLVGILEPIVPKKNIINKSEDEHYQTMFKKAMKPRKKPKRKKHNNMLLYSLPQACRIITHNTCKISNRSKCSPTENNLRS